MTRRLLNLLTVLSLLLCAAAVALWVRGYWPGAEVEVTLAGVRWEVAARTAWLSVSNDPQVTAEKKQWHAAHRRMTGKAYRLGALANASVQLRPYGPADREQVTALVKDAKQARAALQAYERTPQSRTPRRYSVPWAAVAAVSLVLPATWSVRHARQMRRPDPNSCLHCGYDLTGNVSGVCPECGRAR